MNIRIGTVTAVDDRFLTVKLYHSEQTITKVVKTSRLDLDEREAQPNIKIDTEVLLVEDDYGTTYALGSLSQGIALIKKGISRIENAEVQIYGEDIKLMSADGDNTSTVEKKANTVDVWTEKINIRNDATNLVQLIADLAQSIADSTPIGGSSKDKDNKEKSNALSIKAKIEAYL